MLKRGYSFTEISQRLDVLTNSLYKWVKAVKPDNPKQHASEQFEAKSELSNLRAQLRRIAEERDTLTKADPCFQGNKTKALIYL